MSARARATAVLAIVLGGAAAIIASTQTWLEVALRAGAIEPLAVPGTSALPLVAPLSLAAVALGLALTVVGRALRYAFGVIALIVGGALLITAGRVALTRPVDAAAAVVTKATGLSGDAAVADLVAAVTGTAWPFVAAVAGLVIGVGGILTLATAHRWRRSGRRYRREPGRGDSASGQRPSGSPRDRAIDSWDDLTHGADPTAR